MRDNLLESCFEELDKIYNDNLKEAVEEKVVLHYKRPVKVDFEVDKDDIIDAITELQLGTDSFDMFDYTKFHNMRDFIKENFDRLFKEYYDDLLEIYKDDAIKYKVELEDLSGDKLILHYTRPYKFDYKVDREEVLSVLVDLLWGGDGFGIVDAIDFDNTKGFVEKHFKDLFKEYYNDLLDVFAEDALAYYKNSKLTEAYIKDPVILHYEDFPEPFDYIADKEDVLDVLDDICMSIDICYADFPNMNERQIEECIRDNFNETLEKYYNIVLEYFKDDAIAAYDKEHINEGYTYRNIKDPITLHYKNLDYNTEQYAGKWYHDDPGYYTDEYNTIEHHEPFDFEVAKEDVIDVLYDICISDDIYDKDFPGKNEQEIEQYIRDNFDEILKKHYDKILEEFEEDAQEAAQDAYYNEEQRKADEAEEETI